MRYGAIVWHDHMNGPGTRLSIWLTGCPFRCPNCFNEELWERESGKELTPYIENQIIKAMDEVDGITLLGGEPLAPHNYEWVKKICAIAKDKGIGTMIYTGYRYEEIPYEMDKYVDCYVDGMYIDQLRSNDSWRGSRNQRCLRKVRASWNPDLDYFMEVESPYENFSYS